jgi:hypothetical protein
MTVKELLDRCDMIMAKPTRTSAPIELLMRAQIELELMKMMAPSAAAAAQKLAEMTRSEHYEYKVVPSPDGSTLVIAIPWVSVLEYKDQSERGAYTGRIYESELEVVRRIWSVSAPIRSAGYRVHFSFKDPHCQTTKYAKHEFNTHGFLPDRSICIRCGFVEAVP